MQYAVRGEIPMIANRIKGEIDDARQKGMPNPYPFEKVLFCNIGNPQ